MGRDIKQLKPVANGRTKQCYLDPRSCKKLYPGLNSSPIICRSSWEKKFALWCEQCDKVKYWGSECMTIPYTSLIDHSPHTYNPDFVVEFENGKKWIVEIKPKSQCKRPMNQNGWLWNEYTKNMAKWSAAKRFCEDRGIEFKIFTENTIAKL